MRAIRKLISIILVSALLFMVGCSSVDNPGNANNSNQSNKIRIGVCFDSFVIERWQRDRDVFVSMAKDLGAEVNVQNANGDVATQKKQIDYFIEEQMDAIVIIAIDGYDLADSVEKAKDAGIIVVAYDRLICDANVDLYISFDNVRVGQLMGQALVDAGVTDSNVLMLGGSDLDNNVTLVESGFRGVMELNNNTIVDSIHATNWKAEIASDYVRDNEEIVMNCSAIMCGNDNLASQVVPALSEMRMAGTTLVVGQDADLEACQRIVEGTQLMTVYKPVEHLAKRAAELTIMLIKERDISGEEGYQIINDGTFDIPYIALEPVMVTKDNMDEVIINSGFHLREDVYLNIPDKDE
ncbi:MAG: substrate-binding domain-containing protein [Saccharofermentans sp.]|nr:substrate-binding domain-containing protein [Saccharofermentans sp.]